MRRRILNTRFISIRLRSANFDAESDHLFSEGKLIANGVTNEKGETLLAQSHVPQDAVIKFLELVS